MQPTSRSRAMTRHAHQLPVSLQISQVPAVLAVALLGLGSLVAPALLG